MRKLQARAYEIAKKKGWIEPDNSFGDFISEVHGEVSEAFEEFKDNESVHCKWKNNCGRPEGVPSELADVVIRIMSYCGEVGIDLHAEIIEKMDYNETKPIRKEKRLKM